MALKIIPKKKVRRNYGCKGNTTIIGDNIGWGGMPLQFWANKMGRVEGLTMPEAWALATVPGSIVHAMIEAQLTDMMQGEFHFTSWKDLVDFEFNNDDVDLANNSYRNFLAWWEEKQFKPVAVEPQLICEIDTKKLFEQWYRNFNKETNYPLDYRDAKATWEAATGGFKKYKYGTTPDLLADSPRGLAMLDWKSGKIYEKTLVQLAAGQIAWEQNNPNKPIEGGFHIARIPRNDETLSFHHSFWDVLPPEAWEAFEHALRLNEIQEILNKYM